MIIRKIDFLVCMLVVCSLNINTAMAQSRSYEGGITCLLYTSDAADE